MNVIAVGISDVGLQREHNEDSYCLLPHHDLFVVADGMGGHAAGDVASKMATSLVAQFFETSRGDDATWPFHFDPHLTIEENRLITGIKVANRQIFDLSTREASMSGMGTTIVTALFGRVTGKMYLAHVGDSRAYRIRGNEITQLTRDHSLLNDWLLLMPDISEAQREELPKNVITRALGMQDSVVVDLVEDTCQPGDRYLLCSDGLSGMITDEGIGQIVANGRDLDACNAELIRVANENGGDDNITVVLIEVTE